MKFTEMKYIRPDMDEFKNISDKCTDSLANAANADEAADAYIQWDKACRSFETMGSLCYIKHSVNTEDKFFSDENDFFDESNPLFDEMKEKVVRALANSPFRPQMAERFGEIVFKNADIFLSGFNAANIPLQTEENKLVSEYEKLIASAQIEFDGKICTISELGPYKQSPDDDVRHRAWAAESGFYSEHKAELDSIYHKLVELRHKQGLNSGFKDYVDLGYIRMNRNSYTKEDIEKFRNAIVKYIVPLAVHIYKMQAERIGVAYPLKYNDTPLFYRDGNALPKGNAEEILETGKEFYQTLSPECAEFIDFMMDNELFDVLSRKGKMQGGYCTELPDFHCPFIFANFNGTQDDIEVITHEAGHAFAAYVNRDAELMDTMLPTIEACEIHSMTMEFFGYSFAEKFFGEDGNKYIYKHLADAIKFLPYGAMVDHFQQDVYEHPEMSPDDRIELWKRLTAVYMPWLDLDGSPFYGEGRAWQRQGHIYERPFYYIDYCLAQTAALEFRAVMDSSPKEAFERYYSLVKLGGTKTFTELVTAAGLDSPFDENALRTAAEAAEKKLRELEDKLDLKRS